jgi:hypothetical protein
MHISAYFFFAVICACYEGRDKCQNSLTLKSYFDEARTKEYTYDLASINSMILSD